MSFDATRTGDGASDATTAHYEWWVVVSALFTMPALEASAVPIFPPPKWKQQLLLRPRQR